MKNNTVSAPMPGATNIAYLCLRGCSATIDTRVLAEVFGRPHKSVLRTIDELISDGTISRHEFVPRDYSSRGKKYRCYELNEAGFLKSMPFIGGRKSREGQKILVDEFLKMKRVLAKQSKERESQAYQMVRAEGKDSRRLLTDAIEKFIDYAVANGSNNAKMYFSNITNLIYRNLLTIDPKASQVREILTAVQLSRLQTLELVTAQFLIEGIESDQHYKLIYKQLKAELELQGSGKASLLC